MRPVKIGMIGCGNVGQIHARALEGVSVAKLTAVADTNPRLTADLQRRYGCAAYTDYRELLQSDVELITVCLPPALHCQVTLEAAAAGKHVLVEKPLDVSPEQADRMIRACREAGVKLGTVSQHRFDPVIVTIRRLLDEGRLGRLLMGSSRTIWYRAPEYYRTGGGWRASRENQGGVLMSQSIHYIDLLQYLMGGVEAVSAMCETLLHDIQVEDTGLAHVRFRGGAVGSIEGTTVAYPGLQAELTLYTEQATVRICNDRLDFYAAKFGSIPELDVLMQGQGNREAAVSDPLALDVTSHQAQFRDMAEAIRQDREPLITGEEGRKVVAIIDAIHRSASLGEWVRV